MIIPDRFEFFLFSLKRLHGKHDNRKLKQPRRRQQQERCKFAYLTMKNSIFARFARAVFIFGHLADVLVLSTTWNDLFCSRVDDVSIDDKCFTLSAYLWSAGSNLIPEKLEHILLARVCLSSIMSLLAWKRSTLKENSLLGIVTWSVLRNQNLLYLSHRPYSRFNQCLICLLCFGYTAVTFVKLKKC